MGVEIQAYRRTTAVIALALLVAAAPAAAQVTPAAGYTPPDDTPAIKVGATFFGDYTITQKPKIKDADLNEITPSAFNVGRAYLNITGNISHIIAFRITPDIVREAGTGSSVNGSYTFRLKYAYAQFNLDDWMNRGSWLRFGMQQTPWVDFMETVFRYRFQGTTFEDREGFLSSSDVGASLRYNLPGNYGDVHAGIYNGETYSKPEANDQKGFMIRASVRPMRMHPVLRGLRVTGFYDHDAYVKDAERRRGIVALTFEHKYLNSAFDYMAATDQNASASKPKVDARGFSVWATPRATNGWEGLIRYDHLEPNTDSAAKKNRTLAGVAYWFPHQGSVSAAMLFDVEQVKYSDFTPARATERRIALHALVNF